jgi:hypothetical protein
MNQTLCNQCFAGNTDLYGLGICTGLHLQWISSFLANTGDPAKTSEILPDIFFGYLPRDGHCKLGQGLYFRHRD